MHFLRPDAAWLLLLLVVPAVLFLLPLPRVKRLIASTVLWRRMFEEQRASSRRRLLRVFASLVVNLVILLLIIFALGRVWFDAAPAPSGDLVVLLLDNSASMLAPDGKGTRFDHAKALASDFLRTLSPDTRVAVVTTSPTPGCVVRPSAGVTPAALRGIEAVEGEGAVIDTMEWADSAFGGSCAIHVFTDEAGGEFFKGSGLGFAGSSPVVGSHEVGQSLPNAGIVSFGAIRVEVPKPGILVQARVDNFDNAPRDVTLALLQDGAEIDSRTMTLPPDASAFSRAGETRSRTTVQWTIPDVDNALISLRMKSGDAFALDDHADLRMPPRHRKRVVLVADHPPAHLLSALRANRAIRTFTTTPGKYHPNLESDLTIFVGTVPPETGREPIVLVAPKPGTKADRNVCPTPLTFGDPVAVDNVTVDAGDPLLTNIDWRPGLVRKASAATVPEGADVVVGAPHPGPLPQGERGTPLIFSADHAGRKTVVLNFDPESEPIAATQVFPLLVNNIVSDLCGASRVERGILVDASGKPTELPWATESDLRLAGTGSRSTAGTSWFRPATFWSLLILAAATLMTVEAVLYHRRAL